MVDAHYVTEDSTVVLVPRRDLLADGEIVDWMRYDKTEEIHEGLPLFRQSGESCDVEINGELVTVVPMQRDGPRSAGEMGRG